MIRIECGDCLDVMRGLPDNSVDLIATDPPYFRVKNLPWDRQWDNPAKFIAWIGELCREWQRVLKPNGSLYVFASPKMAARVEVAIGETFEVLNRIRWLKANGWHRKAEQEALRSYLSPWEEIIFAEQFGADSHAKGEAGYGAKCDELRGFVFEPLRAYLDGERRRAGIDKADCNAACGFSRSAGGMASRHYFSRSQWCLPTADHYAALQKLFNAPNDGGEYLRRKYAALCRKRTYAAGQGSVMGAHRESGDRPCPQIRAWREGRCRGMVGRCQQSASSRTSFSCLPCSAPSSAWSPIRPILWRS